MNTHHGQGNLATDNSVLSFELVVGSRHGDSFTIRPGDTAFAGPGDDTVTIAPVIGTGDVTGPDRATVFGGPGNDTIIDLSVTQSEFPVTAFGGPGNDTFVALSAGSADTTYFTGGPGHDLFHFSTEPFHGASNVTITDFSRQDAIVIDVNSADPPAITFSQSGGVTELNAVANGGQVHVALDGTFDTSKFHVTDDGQGHAIVTYGNGGDWLLS